MEPFLFCTSGLLLHLDSRFWTNAKIATEKIMDTNEKVSESYYSDNEITYSAKIQNVKNTGREPAVRVQGITMMITKVMIATSEQ